MGTSCLGWGLVVAVGLAGGAETRANVEPPSTRALAAEWSEIRLREARELTVRGEFEAAARIYIEVWTLANAMDRGVVERTYCAVGLRWLSAKDAGAWRAARDFRDRLAPDISPARLEALDWSGQQRDITRWFELNEMAADDEAVVAWVRTLMEAPSGRELARKAFVLREKLWAARAWTELAWLYGTGAGAIAETTRLLESVGTRLPLGDRAESVALSTFAALAARPTVVVLRARIVAAYRGAGNEAEAQAALAAIRLADPTPTALTGVVSVLLEAGLARSEDAALLDEAERGGLDVAVFREALAEALKAAEASKP